MSLNPIESTNEPMFELPSALIKCRVTVRTMAGDHNYDGLYHSTIDAVIDAQERAYPMDCKIKVKVL